MAKVVVGAEVKVEGGQQAAQTVGNIKKELKEANLALIEAQRNFGEYSKEALDAAKKVATLRDSIQDARETAELFDPGKKFQAFAGVLNTVAGGLAAVQGAQTLLGDESEELQKTLAKVQGALALSQGLSAITDSAKDFQRLGAIVKGPIVAAFTSLRGALIATGVGALAIGITMLIANFEKVKEAVMNFIPGLKSVADFIGNVVNAITDFIGVTSEAERATERFIKATEKEIKATEELLDANGDRYDDYAKRIINANLEFKKKRNEILKDETKSEKEKQDLILQYAQKAQREQEKANADQAAAKAKQIEEEKKKEKEAQDKRVADNKAANDKILADRKALRDLLQEVDDDIFKRRSTAFENELRQIEKLYQQRLDRAKGNADAIQAIEIARGLAQREAVAKEFAQSVKDSEAAEQQIGQTKIDGARLTNEGLLAAATAFRYSETEQVRAAAEVQKAIDREKNEAFVANVSNALNQIADVLGQQSAIGKAVSVASAIINTYQGATKALAQGGLFGFVGAAAVIAAGFKSVKSILATKIPGAKGAGPVAAATATAVSAPVQPQAATTRLDQQTINAVGNAAQAGRAYVLETDVSNNQERVRRINRAARIN